ncbi:MAG: carbonate dehydratase [Nitrospiraceae bacterium]|nr:MAG: carbonate dehydratase [Nitrospiraceae bacterium]
MKSLSILIDNNRKWAEQLIKKQPDFFRKLSLQQSPDYLWIGCADSRVPANEIVGLLPGELFVHRNVANIVSHTDMNCLSVLQYAIDILKVKDVIVCGHYGCGGVKAAIEDTSHGLIDNWLRSIRNIYHRNAAEFVSFSTESDKLNKLCELNVREQVLNVANTTIIQDAWARAQKVAIHGWIYDIADGLLTDLGVCIESKNDLAR